MKLSFVEMSGFRGYRDQIRIDFGFDVTIIDGRNGVGKSTIFDAVEFALTGSIAKYQEAKANKENVDDYIWWIGSTEGPDERYVSVGFIDDGMETVVKRTSLQPESAENLQIVIKKLFDEDVAPSAALGQLCKSTIIRDELIAALSLDLKETDRYALLSSAIGASGSDEWIAKAKEIHEASKLEKKSAAEQSERTKFEATQAQMKVDQQRARSQNDQQLRTAISQLEELLNQRLSPEDASAIAQDKVSKLRSQHALFRRVLQTLQQKLEAEAEFQSEATDLDNLRDHMEELAVEAAGFRDDLLKFDLTEASDRLASQLNELASLGEDIGCSDATCPLCKSKISKEQYEQGILSLRKTSAQMNSEIATSTKLKNNISDIEAKLTSAGHEAVRIEQRIALHQETIETASHFIEEAFPESEATEQELVERLDQLAHRISGINEILPRIDIAGQNTALQNSLKKFERQRLDDKAAERQLSLAEQKETDCKKLYDAVKKAANDAFNQRLERVLPLITELYSRLRPHPNFQKIDYKIRGELRGFLSFSVGKDINPQFIYSSGQRRATGLAFLISVNLSMAWSRWSSLLLDDPVQHIDDFRSVHLAELLGQLVREKRQIICAVEDPALADLLCRKMPVLTAGAAKRVTLGVDEKGEIKAVRKQDLSPMPTNILQDGASGIAV